MIRLSRFLCILIISLPLLSHAMSHKAKTASSDEQNASATLVASSAFVDLMPTTDRTPKTMQILLTFRYTGPGRIVDVPIHIFYDDSQEEQFPNSVTKHQADRVSMELLANDTSDVQKKYLLPKFANKMITINWIEPKTKQAMNSTIELKKVY